MVKKLLVRKSLQYVLSKLTHSLLLQQLQCKMLLLMMCSERCHLEQVPRDEYRLHREKETVSKTARESYHSKQKFKNVEEYSYNIQRFIKKQGGQNCR